MVFTVFTGSVELAFLRHRDFEGLGEQSIVFTVFSKAQSSWPFEVTAILKAQSSKAWYLLCLAWCLQAQSRLLFEVTVILKV